MSDQPRDPREKILETNAYSTGSRRWLFVCVGVFLTIMLGLWGYATFSELSLFDWNSTAEAKLIARTREEFNNLSKDNPLINGKIKERIEQAKTEAAEISVTSTTSTVPVMATTTKQ